MYVCMYVRMYVCVRVCVCVCVSRVHTILKTCIYLDSTRGETSVMRQLPAMTYIRFQTIRLQSGTENFGMLNVLLLPCLHDGCTCRGVLYSTFSTTHFASHNVQLVYNAHYLPTMCACACIMLESIALHT